MNPDNLAKALVADLVITSTKTGDIVSAEWKEPYMHMIYYMHGQSFYKALKNLYFVECDLYVQAGQYFDVDWWSAGSRRVQLSARPAT